MRTLKITLAYDGTRFVGWQRQPEGESVQGLLEGALAALEGAPVPAHGAGRTDAGVHALAQVASARVSFAHGEAVVVRALNARLPPDVRVTAVEVAPEDFHARFHARSKHYRYQIDTSPVADPFTRSYAWHVPDTLDRDAIRAAAAACVGTHDFSAFRSAGTEVHTSVRTLTRSEWREDGRLLVYDVAGDGFLRHMVRAMVGTFVEVGRGARPSAQVAALLAGASRREAGATAPAHGLALARVEY
jgi:tRNA pseudouridine38-40 synthase